jgi:hypothetical protein
LIGSSERTTSAELSGGSFLIFETGTASMMSRPLPRAIIGSKMPPPPNSTLPP